jgi:TetR/AcrR family transcriptional regulator, transcriptional repressor for nem operon
MTISTRDKILELAQEAIASRGYSSFSFRELATELGIKSASVHYHFPSKTHLGVAVARAWRERLALALNQIAATHADPKQALAAWIDIYRQEANTSQRMTVCTMLAAEIKNLPGEVQLEMKAFYELNFGWIEARLTEMGLNNDIKQEKARQLFALLQGGLIGAKGQNDPAYFDVVAKAVNLLI